VGPDRVQMMVFAAITAAVPIVICVVIIVTSRRAASGKLPRNQYVGIRTPSTMRSDAAWVAAHRAATRLTPLYLVITAIVCAAVLWAALYASSPGAVITVGLGGFAVLIVALIYTSIIAGKAAKSADRGTGGRQPQ
jgi:uncharacterized membrane protein